MSNSFAILWTVAHQAPLSLGFSRQEYWRGLPCPLPGHLPNPEIEAVSPAAPALQMGSLPPSHQGSCNAVCRGWLAGTQRRARKDWIMEERGSGEWLAHCVNLCSLRLAFTLWEHRHLEEKLFIKDACYRSWAVEKEHQSVLDFPQLTAPSFVLRGVSCIFCSCCYFFRCVFPPLDFKSFRLGTSFYLSLSPQHLARCLACRRELCLK